MAWSDAAKKRAIYVFETLLVDNGPIREQMKSRLLAALDAAAAVDGDPVDIRTVTAYESGFEAGKNEADDAEWNAAISEAEKLLRTAGGICKSSAYVACADAIRSLKRLK